MRQVFLTFGNDNMGQFLLGRNIGLFGADAILNDMTLPGVGAGNGNYATPSNTSLGSIGLGYIYTDWLAQIDYTTRDFGGFKFTIGIFDPLEPLGQALPRHHGAAGKRSRLAREGRLTRVSTFYFSASVISQQHNGVTDASDFDSFGFDIGGKITFGDAEFLAWYYQGEGLGTTALFLLASDGLGERARLRWIPRAVHLQVRRTQARAQLRREQPRSRAGRSWFPTWWKRTRSTRSAPTTRSPRTSPCSAEFTDTNAEAHNGVENDSSNFNLGAYLSF